MADALDRCTNCGADLSVLRVSACCNHPRRVVDFPMEFPSDPIEPLKARITALEDHARMLAEALTNVDALDPEGNIDACSHSALRGLVLRMGEIARAALVEHQKIMEGK